VLNRQTPDSVSASSGHCRDLHGIISYRSRDGRDQKGALERPIEDR
jgi:hypothetical protein